MKDTQQQSNYEKVTQIITSDPRYVKEASLGKRVGYYRMHGQLGSGNFSEVKLGVHSLLREKVAVKILDKTKLDQKTKRLLSREISSMESLSHPNIVRLYEVVESLAKLNLIMEYASGGELFTKVTTEGKLLESEAKTVFIQITSALEHMHEHDVIHRDLKAENVFYAAPLVVKIGDFGFSTVSAEAERLNTFCGSPPYAAPELFRDDYYEGRFVDVWALGVLLYFIMTGIMPFRADTVGKLKRCILNNPVTIPSYVPNRCQALINNLLSKVPKDRWKLNQVMKCDWLDGQDMPSVLPKFEKDVCKAASSRSSNEQDAIAILHHHGVNGDVIKEAHGCGVKSHVTGIYRIVLHRVQRQAETGNGRSHGASDRSLASFNSSSRHSYRNGNGVSTMGGSQKDNKQSRLCTIL